MGKIQNAINWAVAIANDDSHKYSQSNRWGPHYDCSSFLITAYRNSGLTINANTTRDMYSGFTSAGFSDVKNQVNVSTGSGLIKGDVLLCPGNHTVMYIGNGQIVHAATPSAGILVQKYYSYSWNYVLRYPEKIESEVKNPVRRLVQGSAHIDRACNLYSDTDTNSSVLVHANKDDHITILDTGTTWVKVRYNSTLCFGQCDYILQDFAPGDQAETVLNANITIPKGTPVVLKDSGYRGNMIEAKVYIPSTSIQKK